MGLFDFIFKHKPTPAQEAAQGWRTLTELSPTFSTWDGRVYEQELTRAAIERFASACSKLRPEFNGTAPERTTRFLRTMPNDFMTWPQLLKRAAAIYESFGTAVVVPVLDPRDQESVVGVYPLMFSDVEVVDVGGEPWCRFHFPTGDVSVVELSRCVVLTRLQVDSDVFGEPNCLDETLKLIHAQQEAQDAAIRNGATIRFLGAINGMAADDEIRKKQKWFREVNLGPENEGGIMVYDNRFVDVRQIDPKSYTIDDAEMQRIQDNVCTYFGCSMRILQNDYTEDQWGAWYEGRIEPFAIQFGEGLTRMCFTPNQLARGNRITFSSNRLEYASNPSKRNMVRDMVDRGIFSLNEGREILQLPPIEGGDVRVIRGEYMNAAAVSSFVNVEGGGRMPKNVNDGERDPGGDDQIYQDSDAHGTVDAEY